MSRLLVFLLLAAPAVAADPPGLAVADSEPKSLPQAGAISVAAGRFVPLSVAGGKPALVLGNEAGLLELFPLPAGHTVLGVRWDEPAGAKAKRYTFPAGPVTIAVAGDTGGSVTLKAVVNGPADGPPTVAGTLVLTLTAPLPPPGPTPPGPVPPGPVPPGPTPPTPQPVTSFRVIFVSESATTLPLGQQGAMDGKAVRDWLTANTTPEGGYAGWRKYDPQQMPTVEQPTMKALWDAAKTKLTTLPCLIVEVNGKAEIVPLPASADASLAMLKKYKGQ